MLIIGDLSACLFYQDRHVIFIDTELAIMQLQLALETQGLASCAANLPDTDHCDCKIVLGLDFESYQRMLRQLAVWYLLVDMSLSYSAKELAVDFLVRPK